MVSNSQGHTHVFSDNAQKFKMLLNLILLPFNIFSPFKQLFIEYCIKIDAVKYCSFSLEELNYHYRSVYQVWSWNAQGL